MTTLQTDKLFIYLQQLLQGDTVREWDSGKFHFALEMWPEGQPFVVLNIGEVGDMSGDSDMFSVDQTGLCGMEKELKCEIVPGFPHPEKFLLEEVPVPLSEIPAMETARLFALFEFMKTHEPAA